MRASTIASVFLTASATVVPGTAADRTDKLADGYTVVYIDTVKTPAPDQHGDLPGVIRPRKDYYAIFLEGVYIDKDPTFFKHNNFAITMDVTTEGQPLSLPLYTADRTAGAKLGISHYGLVNSIPANGNPVKIGVTIVRRDEKDPVKQTIDLLNGADNSSILRTYAASAIPYIGLVGVVAKQLYGMFAADGDANPMLQHLPVTLSPYDGSTYDKHTLRDTTMLIYKTNKSFDASLFDVDANGSVYYDKKPFKDVRWVAVRLQRFAKRQDYAGREWQKRFDQAIAAALGGQATNDYTQADRLLVESSVLLASDQDYTSADRQQLQTEHQQALALIKHSVQTAANTGEAASTVAASSVTPMKLMGTITATSDFITVAPGVELTATQIVNSRMIIDALKDKQ